MCGVRLSQAWKPTKIFDVPFCRSNVTLVAYAAGILLNVKKDSSL